MSCCERCGTRGSGFAKFCSRCGFELSSTLKTSKAGLSNSRIKSLRGIALAFVSVILLGVASYATIYPPSLNLSFENILNPIPEKVFLQLKPVANPGWLQSIELDAQLESNKPNSYQAILELKKGSEWKTIQVMNVIFDNDNMAAQNLSFSSGSLEPGTRELRIKVLRGHGNQGPLEISDSIKVRILKLPNGMQIANDSGNAIVWRFTKDNEEPQYCAKYNRCFFLKVASTKRCTIKVTHRSQGQSGKVVSINNTSKSSIGSVAAYTPEKSYLIEVPTDKDTVSPDISARCFALSSGSNQGSIPTPTRKPQKPAENPACSRIIEDIESTVMYIWNFDFDQASSYQAPNFKYEELADYRREFELFQCSEPNSWSYSTYSRLRNW